jgi:hypothetical protein
LGIGGIKTGRRPAGNVRRVLWAADNPNGQDGGLLFGNGGAGWTTTTAGVGGGDGGNGGLQRP